MRTYKTVGEAMDQRKTKLVMFKKVKPRQAGTMRPGKTRKDKTVTKSWGNRFENQQARAELANGKK